MKNLMLWIVLCIALCFLGVGSALVIPTHANNQADYSDLYFKRGKQIRRPRIKYAKGPSKPYNLNLTSF